MPQPGEIRRGQTESVQWDGSRWQPIAHEGADQSQQPGALSRFVSGAASTTPFNPMNALHALMHPIDTIGGAVSDSLHGVQDAASHLSNAVTNPGNEDALGRLTELVQGVKSAGSAVPFIGKPATDAGDKIGNGDIAGGTGELAGLASSALLPKVPGGMSKVGGAMETAGDSLSSMSMHSPLGNLTIPAAGMADALIRHDPYGLAVAGAPYALKYGGKGLRAAGDALQGLTRTPVDGEVMPDQSPAGVPYEEGKFAEGPSTAPSWGTDVARTGSTAAPSSDVLPRTGLPPAGADNLLSKGGEFNMPDSVKGLLPPSSGAFEMPASSERFMSDINPHELGYAGELPKGSLDVVEPGEPPSHEGQEVPSSEDVEGLIKGLLPQQEPGPSSGPSASPASFRALDRGDEFWGPGTMSRSGAPAMADESSRMLYDPQTPSDYLREQIKTAGDPGERDYLLRAYRQRLNIGRRPGASADATGAPR